VGYAGVCTVYSGLFIFPLSIYSKGYQSTEPVFVLGVKYMAESKIIEALEKFSRDYAWDKSLIVPATNSSEPGLCLISSEHSNTSIEDFINGSRES